MGCRGRAISLSRSSGNALQTLTFFTFYRTLGPHPAERPGLPAGHTTTAAPQSLRPGFGTGRGSSAWSPNAPYSTSSSSRTGSPSCVPSSRPREGSRWSVRHARMSRTDGRGGALGGRAWPAQKPVRTATPGPVLSTRRGFSPCRWAWVDSNYRPHVLRVLPRPGTAPAKGRRPVSAPTRRARFAQRRIPAPRSGPAALRQLGEAGRARLTRG